MSYEQLMNSIATAQRDAGEKEVIAHLEAIGLVGPSPIAVKIRNIAAAMYHAYGKQGGGKTFDGKPLPTYLELGADRQACWEAAAHEAIAQVAAMNATGQRLSP